MGKEVAMQGHGLNRRSMHTGSSRTSGPNPLRRSMTLTMLAALVRSCRDHGTLFRRLYEGGGVGDQCKVQLDASQGCQPRPDVARRRQARTGNAHFPLLSLHLYVTGSNNTCLASSKGQWLLAPKGSCPSCHHRPWSSASFPTHICTRQRWDLPLSVEN